MKLLYICLNALIIAVISLILHISANRNMPLWGKHDAIPNEDVAKKVADIIIEAQMDRMEISNDQRLIYDFENVEITYNNKQNEWKVYYLPKPLDGVYPEGGDITIYLRRDSGMVTSLGFGK